MSLVRFDSLGLYLFLRISSQVNDHAVELVTRPPNAVQNESVSKTLKSVRMFAWTCFSLFSSFIVVLLHSCRFFATRGEWERIKCVSWDCLRHPIEAIFSRRMAEALFCVKFQTHPPHPLQSKYANE